MKTKFRDVAHLYLGCECDFCPIIGVLTGREIDLIKNGSIVSVKPILRPLSDMTDEEKTLALSFNSDLDSWICGAKRTQYLLSLGFDLFGLIESDEAIDKTTLK